MDKENEVYSELVELTKKANIQEWQNKVLKYEKHGLSEDDADKKANKILRKEDNQMFI
jgi:hypothetical protein